MVTSGLNPETIDKYRQVSKNYDSCVSLILIVTFTSNSFDYKMSI